MTTIAESRCVESLGLRLRPSRDHADDARQFCRLSNSLYARKVEPAYYRWQFFSTPFPCELMFATTTAGELVGCYGVQVRDSSLGVRSVAMALDIMIAPNFQKRGLFCPLADAALQAALHHAPKAIYVMANERAHLAHVHALGWQPVQVIEDAVCDTQGACDQIEVGSCTVPIEQFSAADRDFVRNARQPADANDRLSMSRSAADINWRIVQNPRYAYQILRCQRERKTIGFLLLKQFRDLNSGEASGDVLDVMASTDDRETYTLLLRLALAHFHRQGIARATTWLAAGTSLGDAGRAVGFVHTSRRRYQSCRVFDDSYAWLHDRTRWSVSMLDTDLY